MTSRADPVASLRSRLAALRRPALVGRVTRVVGLTVESKGPPAALGEACWIFAGNEARPRLAEVVGFRDGRLLLMPWQGMDGIAEGDGVQGTGAPLSVPAGPGVLGRILDPSGQPLDDRGPLRGTIAYVPLVHAVPAATRRRRIRDLFTTGIKAIDTFVTLGVGQRLGIFAGSGVGKSTLLGMVCRYAAADVIVVALVGERGREVMEFVEKDLSGALGRTVLVVATSDQPALVRTKAVVTANTIADAFRRQGRHVLLLVDSLTRLAMAQREVGLAVGEPPATRGYPPSVFGLFPTLLEQAGQSERGAITGIYTVLTEGDDWNDPISDCVRSILDGHVLLTRRLATEGHYPAIDPLDSLSRLQPDLLPAHRVALVTKARAALAIHRQYRELIEIGAYTKGSNPELDRALVLVPRLMAFLRQEVMRRVSPEESWNELANALR